MTKFTRGDISLRLATMKDAQLLLDWRNDPATRGASKNSSVIPLQVHSSWLAEVILDPNRQLYVAETCSAPFGTVRADLLDGRWQLSWTVASGFRKQGFAKIMVALLADNLNGEISAEIKTENMASIRVAEHANMYLDHQANEILYFLRTNKS